MARIIPEGFAEAGITFSSTTGTPPYVTTIGCSLVGLGPEDWVDTANLLMGNYRESFEALTLTAFTCEFVDLAIGLPGGTSGSIRSTAPPWTGGRGGAGEPAAMAPIANKLTGTLGRKGRGRCFLVGVLADADVNNDGTVETVAAGLFNTAWNEFLTGMATPPVGSAYPPVLLHADGSTPSPIVGGSISSQVGWVRKRLR